MKCESNLSQIPNQTNSIQIKSQMKFHQNQFAHPLKSSTVRRRPLRVEVGATGIHADTQICDEAVVDGASPALKASRLEVLIVEGLEIRQRAGKADAVAADSGAAICGSDISGGGLKARIRWRDCLHNLHTHFF